MLILDKDMPTETALITMKSTQRKKSKKWNSMMQSIKEKKKDGSGFYKPAMFTQVYNLKTVLEKNSLGSWYGWDIEHVSKVPNNSVLQAAHDFYKSCSGGEVKVKYDNEETAEKAPF